VGCDDESLDGRGGMADEGAEKGMTTTLDPVPDRLSS
jgi:hypothetical protein